MCSLRDRLGAVRNRLGAVRNRLGESLCRFAQQPDLKGARQNTSTRRVVGGTALRGRAAPLPFLLPALGGQAR